MNTMTARFVLRLALPVLMLCGLAALGDPLPVSAQQRLEALGDRMILKTDRLLMQRSEKSGDEVAESELLGSGQTATAMRLLITLPAFTRRCITACND